MNKFVEGIKLFCCGCCFEDEISQSQNPTFVSVPMQNQTKSALDSTVSFPGETIQKRQYISHSLRTQVWTTIYNDPPKFQVSCPICEKTQMEIHNAKTWEVSHVVAHACGGSEELENLKPICKPCNRKMKTLDMRDYIKETRFADYNKIFKILKLTPKN